MIRRGPHPPICYGPARSNRAIREAKPRKREALSGGRRVRGARRNSPQSPARSRRDPPAQPSFVMARHAVTRPAMSRSPGSAKRYPGGASAAPETRLRNRRRIHAVTRRGPHPPICHGPVRSNRATREAKPRKREALSGGRRVRGARGKSLPSPTTSPPTRWRIPSPAHARASKS